MHGADLRGAIARFWVSGKRDGLAGVIVPTLVIAALAGLLQLARGRFIDDAYITFSYARTLGRTGLWGMTPGIPSNAATSPLSVLALAAPVSLGIDAELASLFLATVCVAGCLLALMVVSRHLFGSYTWAYLCCALLFTNPLLVSTTGLETQLFFTILLAAIAAWFRGAPGWTGLLCGLLVLARPDGVLLALFLLPLAVRAGRRYVVRFAGTFLSPVISWLAYSWFILGSLVPDTFFIKLAQGGWGDEGFTFVNGLILYLRTYPTAMMLACAPLVLVPLAIYPLLATRSLTTLLYLTLGPAAIHYLGYSLMRVPPYHWYYGWEMSAAIVIATAGAFSPRVGRLARRVIGAGVLPALIVLGAWSSASSLVRAGQMPVQSNWGTAEEYRSIAEWINQHGRVQRFRIDGELGVIQYFTEADAVNEFSDRAALVSPESSRQGSLTSALRRLNFAHLQVPTLPPVGATLSTGCDPQKRYEMSWVTHSPWRSDVTWCWIPDAHP